MIHLSATPQQMSFDFERLPTGAIVLSTDDIHQAVALSSQIPHKLRQWQIYLTTLAVLAFENWLEERDYFIPINRENYSIFQPATANLLSSVCHLQIGQFKLCLIASGSLTDAEVTLPRAVVDLPEFAANFYVLIEVLEEQEYVIIRPFLSYQQLREKLTQANLVPESDWTYQIPLTWFDHEPDRLLLYLRCLEPDAIPLAAIKPQERIQTLSTMQDELANLLPQLQTSQQEIWQVLNWEQGVAILTNLDLLNWVDNAQRNISVAEEQNQNSNYHLSDLIQLVTKPAVNVGRWLWDELDELAQQLSWTLLPQMMPARQMRSPIEEFARIASQLQQQGIEIPSSARGAYQDLLLAGLQLRLYAVTWNLLSKPDPNSWTLLLILGSPLSEDLPHTLKLRVSDKTGILVQQEANREQGVSYLFTRVVGGWDDKFLVSVSLMDGVELTLPPFEFNLGQNV
jgi:hypothetical protein